MTATHQIFGQHQHGRFPIMFSYTLLPLFKTVLSNHFSPCLLTTSPYPKYNLVMKKCRDCPNFVPDNRIICDDCKDRIAGQRRYRSKRKYELRRYGVSEDDYLHMLKEQDGVCMICGRRPPGNRKFCIDHDHNTGAIRGLLCSVCNRNVGIFEVNFDRITKYLRNYHV